MLLGQSRVSHGSVIALCLFLSSSSIDFFFIVFLLDRVGRRKPLLFGSAGITIALICEAVLNSVNPDGRKQGISITGVFFIFS